MIQKVQSGQRSSVMRVYFTDKMSPNIWAFILTLTLWSSVSAEAYESSLAYKHSYQVVQDLEKVAYGAAQLADSYYFRKVNLTGYTLSAKHVFETIAAADSTELCYNQTAHLLESLTSGSVEYHWAVKSK